MQQCSFELNDKPMSALVIGSQSFNAFSGLDPYVNKRAAACTPNLGPIPPGSYYIVDRESGGFLGRLYDM
ncbi:MAG TPA: tlde1 domain-containing protein, partial [Burkholderiaceae bacterium]|nr:tlde1 domain-containing protein [Burkholderiaceae bacterium]